MNSLSPLAALARLGERLAVSPPGYNPQKVSFVLTLYPDGRPPNLYDVRQQAEEGSQRRVPVQRELPAFATGKAGKKIRPEFLWGNATYVLGIDGQWVDSEGTLAPTDFTHRKWEAFRDSHLDWFADCQGGALKVFCQFLEEWDPHQYPHVVLQTDTKALMAGNIIFEVLGEGYLHDLDASRIRWSGVFSASNENLSSGFCPVEGRTVVLAKEHLPVKGVSSHATAKLVSFNEAAFESYGFKRNANAPLGLETADRYGKALNKLLAPRSRWRLDLGGSRYLLFWVDGIAAEERESLFRYLVEPKVETDSFRSLAPAWRDATAGLMKGTVTAAAFRERIETDLDPQGATLCALTLSGESARVTLRDWDTAELSEKLKALTWHYEECWVEPNRFETHPPGILRLLSHAQSGHLGVAYVRDDRIVQQSFGLLQAMLNPNRGYPWGLLHAIVQAIRADQRVNDEYRCALLRGILVRDMRLKQMEEQQIPMSLDQGYAQPAYLLGRLFAILERAQERALGSPNNTIRDSFFASASATPATVFPVLFNKAQHHLGQLRKESRGYGVFLEKLIGEVMDLLPPVLPQSQSVQDQGTFVIGYYHQRQFFFTQRDVQEQESHE